MVKVKICGVTTVEDAKMVVSSGAYALGLNFYEKSPRYIAVTRAKDISIAVQGKVKLVGLFVNKELDKVISTYNDAGMNAVQLHGDEDAVYCRELKKSVAEVWKAVRVKDKDDLAQLDDYSGFVDFFVLDVKVEGQYGGTGQCISTPVLEALSKSSHISKTYFAGGLNPENVSSKIKLLNPYGVDVSSGVESSPGIKDSELVKMFVQACFDA